MEGDLYPLAAAGGMGNVGFSNQGSMPNTIADLDFEPNFRHFDFHLQPDPPSVDVVERVWRVPEGAMDPQHTVLHEGNIKATPVIAAAAMSGALVNYFVTRLGNRTGAQMRWGIYKCVGAMYFYHTGLRWFNREKHFFQDFERNQGFAMEEIRKRRDEQRVREVIWAKQYVADPVSEYRVKQWQTANRFA